MNQWTKNNLSFALQMVALILVTAFALTGPIISFIHQYNLIVEEFGKFIGGIFIYDNYAWWNLTALIWIPYGCYLIAWNRKQDRETMIEMKKLFLNKKEKNLCKIKKEKIYD